MNTPVFREEFRPTHLLSEEYEWMPDLPPRPEGIRFAWGIVLGIAVCLPFWALAWWVVARLF
jgi:hypothetical protein